MISDAYADLELARNIGMTRKRIAIVLGMVSLILRATRVEKMLSGRTETGTTYGS
jgi:hypothetical protein